MVVWRGVPALWSSVAVERGGPPWESFLVVQCDVKALWSSVVFQRVGPALGSSVVVQRRGPPWQSFLVVQRGGKAWDISMVQYSALDFVILISIP